MTQSYRQSAEVQKRLHSMTLSNEGIARRQMYDSVKRHIIPWARKMVRTIDIPSDLAAIEIKNLERVDWPRSVYRYDVLKNAAWRYADAPVGEPYGELSWLDTFDHPFEQSTAFGFDETLGRNKRALKKANSLRDFGTKGDHLSEFPQITKSWLEKGTFAQEAPSIFPGWRTQQSPPDEPKVRMVHRFPGAAWYVECEAFDDGLTKTIDHDKEEKLNVKKFYERPEGIKSWVQEHWSNVVEWVSFDATSYDVTVHGAEVSNSVRYLAGDFEYVDQLAEYITTASIVMPEGDIHRVGGMPSGSKQTNYGDAYTNISDLEEVLRRLKLWRYVICILVNGDDITIGFSTRLSKPNLEKIKRYSRRDYNIDKFGQGRFVLNSKWYIDDSIMTRSIFRVINSMMFKEHQSNPISGSKEYIAVAIAQQLEDVREHPLGLDLAKQVKSHDKYPIETFDQQQLEEAHSAWFDDHIWIADWTDPKEHLEQLRNGIYATA